MLKDIIMLVLQDHSGSVRKEQLCLEIEQEFDYDISYIKRILAEMEDEGRIVMKDCRLGDFCYKRVFRASK